VLRPDEPLERISSLDQRVEWLRKAGADHVVVVAPTAELLGHSAEEFLQDIVLDKLAPTHMVEGPNFFFGRERSGTIDVLREAGQTHGFDVHVVEPISLVLPEGSRRASSTLCRDLLRQGRVYDVSRCLGRAFALQGVVVEGHGRGRGLNFPTINVGAHEQMLPGDGVYAGWADLLGTRHPAAISVGTKPTFGENERAVEAFLLDAEGDYYGEDVRLRFFRRLRDQVRFDGEKALRTQIEKDVARVRELCG